MFTNCIFFRSTEIQEYNIVSIHIKYIKYITDGSKKHSIGLCTQINRENKLLPWYRFREVKSKKNKQRRTTKHNPVHIQKHNTPAENRNITPDQPNKRNSPVGKITETTVITDSLGAGLGERICGKNTCVYVKRGTTVERIHNDIVHNKGYLDSNRLMLLCGTNNKTSLGQTILASDKLIDTAVSLNPTADIYMVALPYRWDNPDLNDKIDTYNTFLKYTADKILQVKILDTSSFQQGRNAYYMKDKLHLNNQGKDLLARTVTEGERSASTYRYRRGKIC